MRFGISLQCRTALAIAATFVLLSINSVEAQSDKPNILVLWGDDIGQSNISAYTFGLVGYETPNNRYHPERRVCAAQQAARMSSF